MSTEFLPRLQRKKLRLIINIVLHFVVKLIY